MRRALSGLSLVLTLAWLPDVWGVVLLTVLAIYGAVSLSDDVASYLQTLRRTED